MDQTEARATLDERLRLAWLAAMLGVGGAVLAVTSVLGAGMAAWSPDIGVAGVGVGMVAGGLGALAGVAALTGARIGRRRTPVPAILGLVIGAVLLTVWGYQSFKARQWPRVHDATTNPADPPAFRALRVAAPDGVARSAWSSGDYPVPGPATLPLTPAQALAKLRLIARDAGWSLVLATPDHLEATDTVPPFGYQDDVAIDLRTIGSNATEVRIRSVGRAPGGDLGRNAARVRGILRALAKKDSPLG